MMPLWRNLSDETVSHFFDPVLWNESSRWSESLRCLCSVNTDSGLSLLIQADERRSFRSPDPFFWNLYQSGRRGRDGNLERISCSLIFSLHLWGCETKAPVGFLTVTFFKSAQSQRCGDTLSRCCALTQRKVTQGIVLPPCECLWLLVKVCGTCRISCIYPLPNICASGINSCSARRFVTRPKAVCMCVTCVKSITQKLWLWLWHLHKSQ